jgi:hypothetical protein
MSETNHQSFDWALWFFWLMATSLGWVLGRFLLPNLAFVTIGLGIGILQWLVLQNRIKNAWQWILVTTLGWALGSVIVMSLIPDGMDFLAGLTIGTTTGTAQWLVLRNKLHWAGWWIVINIVAWTTGFYLLPGIILTGVSAGVITATALGLLYRFPKKVDAFH